MRDEKKGRKDKHQHRESPAKAVTQVVERPVPKPHPHPDHQWDKDRYAEGSNSEAARIHDGEDSGE